VYDRHLLEQVTNVTATLIERTITLENLNEISQKMSELVLEPNKTKLLEKICQKALEMTSAGSASIHLLDYDKEFEQNISPYRNYLPNLIDINLNFVFFNSFLEKSSSVINGLEFIAYNIVLEYIADKLKYYSKNGGVYKGYTVNKNTQYTFPPKEEAGPRLNGKGTTDFVIDHLEEEENSFVFSKDDKYKYKRINQNHQTNKTQSKIVVP
jgi:hypothetical protein